MRLQTVEEHCLHPCDWSTAF